MIGTKNKHQRRFAAPSRLAVAGALLLCGVPQGVAAQDEAAKTEAAATEAAADSASFDPSKLTKKGFAINEEEPESSVPSQTEGLKRPMEMGYLMMALSDRAEAAKAKGDHAKAAKFFRAIAKAAPDRAVGYAKACLAHSQAGQWDQAAEMCHAALGKGGAKLEDYVRFLEATVRKPGQLGAAEIADVNAVLERLQTDLKGTPELRTLQCDVALRLEDASRMSDCVAAMTQAKAPRPKVIAYEWALALMQRDANTAEALIADAAQQGVPSGMVEKMKTRLATEKADWVPPAAASRKAPPWWFIALAGALVLGAGGVIALRNRRRSRLGHAV